LLFVKQGGFLGEFENPNAAVVQGVLLWNVWGQLDAARSLMAQAGPFHRQNLKGHLLQMHQAESRE
jgi:hypothetical protein